jgi:ABC-type sulfate/molybdate transport systems ATPase subunit
MTIAENIAFGLSVLPPSARPPKKEIRDRVLELLKLVKLEGLDKRRPHELSGGQRQRVALARALAIRPKVLLLDEPFGALDAQVRKGLRRWLRQFHDEIGLTTLFVTHDQEEALAIADRVGVMNGGKIEQLAPPVDVYHRPATPFVAEFVGLSNRLPATVSGKDADVLGVRMPLVDGSIPNGSAIALVRPEAVSLAALSGEDAASDPLVGQVVATSFLGAVSRITVDLGEHGSVVAQMPTSQATGFTAGSLAKLTLRQDPVLVISL